jgi:hypothetical protein
MVIVFIFGSTNILAGGGHPLRHGSVRFPSNKVSEFCDELTRFAGEPFPGPGPESAWRPLSGSRPGPKFLPAKSDFCVTKRDAASLYTIRREGLPHEPAGLFAGKKVST